MARYILEIERNILMGSVNHREIRGMKIKICPKRMTDTFDLYVANEIGVFYYNDTNMFSNSKKALIEHGNKIIKDRINELWDMKL